MMIYTKLVEEDLTKTLYNIHSGPPPNQIVIHNRIHSCVNAGSQEDSNKNEDEAMGSLSMQQNQSLSRYSPSAGIATLMFLRLRTFKANSCIFPSSMQFPGMLSQWSNTH